MPISRKQVRQVCSPDEYEVYSASLRVRLPELPPSELHTYIQRARTLVGRMGQGARKDRAFRRTPRKMDLLSGALSRFEGRLRVLAEEKARLRGDPAGGKPGNVK